MNFYKLFFLLVLSFALSANSAELASCSKQSGQQTVALLELYTSEGCSSCPPADKFLSNLYGNTSLTGDQIILLALHVDYWDYIGWKDRFAKPQFSERQEWLARLSHARGIYTPEFFLNGKEFRSEFSDLVSAVHAINAVPAKTTIQMTISRLQTSQFDVEFFGNTSAAGKIYFGLVENNLTTQVKAGENKNKQLIHSYVARTWGDAVDVLPGDYKQKVKLNIPADSVRNNLSLFAFVQTNRGEVLQAISAPLCQ